MSTPHTSLQDLYFPDGQCFGCGPKNPAGLMLRSFAEGDRATARWTPRHHHQAVAGVLCGGVVSTLLDCHSGAALAQAVKARTGRWPFGESEPWATTKLDVELLRPTPLGSTLTLSAHAVGLDDDEAVIDAELHSEGRLRARCCSHWRRVVRR